MKIMTPEEIKSWQSNIDQVQENIKYLESPAGQALIALENCIPD